MHLLGIEQDNALDAPFPNFKHKEVKKFYQAFRDGVHQLRERYPTKIEIERAIDEYYDILVWTFAVPLVKKFGRKIWGEFGELGETNCCYNFLRYRKPKDRER